MLFLVVCEILKKSKIYLFENDSYAFIYKQLLGNVIWITLMSAKQPNKIRNFKNVPLIAPGNIFKKIVFEASQGPNNQPENIFY